jgi:hypothetical protein
MKRVHLLGMRSVVGAVCGSVEARNGTTAKTLIGRPRINQVSDWPSPKREVWSTSRLTTSVW